MPQGIALASILHYHDKDLLKMERLHTQSPNDFGILDEKLSFSRVASTSITDLQTIIGERRG